MHSMHVRIGGTSSAFIAEFEDRGNGFPDLWRGYVQMISRTVLAAILVTGILAAPLHARTQEPVRSSKDRIVRTNFTTDSTKKKAATRLAKRKLRKRNRRAHARARSAARKKTARRRAKPVRLSSLVPASPAKARRGTEIYSRGRYLGKVIVPFRRKLKPGTIYVSTKEKALYYVLPGGRAIKYGVGVGREGFTWSGTHRITMKKEWPEWRPPKEMIERELKEHNRQLPEVMEGGPDNPLGARALYIGNTLYRIHGTNNPRSIGHNVSSGCIRMVNDDVIDLYDRVKVGAKIIVE